METDQPQTTTIDPIDPDTIPWAISLAGLADVLAERGRAAPAGRSLALQTVPQHERNERGLPLFRIVVI